MPSRDVTPFRVFDLWFVMTMVLAPAGISVFSVLLDSSSAVLANAVLSLPVTYALLAVEPGLKSSTVFRLGVFVFCGFLLGRAVGWYVGFPWAHVGVSVVSWVVAVAVGLWWFDYRNAQWVARERESRLRNETTRGRCSPEGTPSRSSSVRRRPR